MKKFLLHITGLVIATLLIMAALDVVYTFVYSNSKPRTKFQMLRALKDKETDYIFLGSSRVDNAIIPSIIKNKTGKSAVNLAFTASKLNDIRTALKLLHAYNIKTEKTFVQVDYIYNLDGNSNIMAYQIMPFIRDNEVTEEHFKKFSNRYLLYYLPFYRYCAYDQKIGMREVFCNLIGKSTYIANNLGFNPMYGNHVDKLYGLPKEINKKNIVFNSIKKFSKDNNIDVVYFCAPFYKETKNLDFVEKLKLEIPDLLDYSSVVGDSKMFGNNQHLNNFGAEYFTNYFIEDLYHRKIIK